MNYEFAVQSDKEYESEWNSNSLGIGNPFFVCPPTDISKVYMCLINRIQRGLLQPETFDCYLQLGGENKCILTATRKTNLFRQRMVIFTAINQNTNEYPKNSIGILKANRHQFLAILNSPDFSESTYNNDIMIVYNSKPVASWRPYEMKIASVHPFSTLNGIISMRSKTPAWDPILKTYVLDFHNRVTIPSVKNFQLETDKNDIVMQFGRVGRNTFTFDFKYPLTLFQAFCISLTRFFL